MIQREFIHAYNDANRPKFNKELFTRVDDDIIEALRLVVYSCERTLGFVIKVVSFDVIDNYDDVNHVLWEYEDSMINKGKSPEQSKSNNKKKDNPFAFINLKDSDLKVIRIVYYIQIKEKKDGVVSDNITVYIAIPRIIDGFYFRLNGNLYSAMYQIVDASTYNNSTARNTKKQSITFKTIFMPIRVYRYFGTLVTIDGEELQCTYFVANMFRKSLLLMKYLLAKFGLSDCMSFLRIEDVYFLQNIDNIDKETNYIFSVRGIYITVPKLLYDSVQIVQSFVYTIHSVLNYMKDTTYSMIFDRSVYIKALGAEFTSKDIDTIRDKGINILGSLEFIYDLLSKKDLHLDEYDKADVYCVLRWMMYEFNALRQKDNLDISTKKVRYAEYLASYYANRLAIGIYRISDKGDKATLDTIRKAIQIPPTYLINAITKCQLVNYKNCVNDLDSIIALKYTYKGISGIGESSNAISNAYRAVHPSHLGKVDLDSSSNSDPGVSGTICPLTNLHDGHFIDYKEPSTWQEDMNKVLDAHRAMNSKKAMYDILKDHKLVEQEDNSVLGASIEVARNLLPFSNVFLNHYTEDNNTYGENNTIDILNDGFFIYEES